MPSILSFSYEDVLRGHLTTAATSLQTPLATQPDLDSIFMLQFNKSESIWSCGATNSSGTSSPQEGLILIPPPQTLQYSSTLEQKYSYFPKSRNNAASRSCDKESECNRSAVATGETEQQHVVIDVCMSHSIQFEQVWISNRPEGTHEESDVKRLVFAFLI